MSVIIIFIFIVWSLLSLLFNMGPTTWVKLIRRYNPVKLIPKYDMFSNWEGQPKALYYSATERNGTEIPWQRVESSYPPCFKWYNIFWNSKFMKHQVLTVCTEHLLARIHSSNPDLYEMDYEYHLLVRYFVNFGREKNFSQIQFAILEETYQNHLNLLATEEKFRSTLIKIT